MQGGEASRMTEVVEQPAWVMQSMEKQAVARFSRYESVLGGGWRVEGGLQYLLNIHLPLHGSGKVATRRVPAQA